MEMSALQVISLCYNAPAHGHFEPTNRIVEKQFVHKLDGAHSEAVRLSVPTEKALEATLRDEQCPHRQEVHRRWQAPKIFELWRCAAQRRSTACFMVGSRVPSCLIGDRFAPMPSPMPSSMLSGHGGRGRIVHAHAAGARTHGHNACGACGATRRGAVAKPPL